jgi:hypothetical protein
MLPTAIDFVEMSYNHKKPVVITEEAKNEVSVIPISSSLRFLAVCPTNA